MRLVLHFIVTTIIKLIVFGVPVSFVAQWCDVEPTWKATAFMAFCIFWADCVFDAREGALGSSAKQDDPSAVKKRKAAADVMTPAQVAAEARKLMRDWNPKPGR